MLISLSFCINAQNEDLRDERKNEIGLSVSDLLNGAYQFQYERMIGDHISVVLGIGFKGDNGLIRLSGLDTDKIQTGDLTYSGFKFVPAVRYYLNSTTKYSMDGFYFGAYTKYSNYKSDLDGLYTDDAGDDFIVEFDADISVLSVGFMAGYKWAISDRFSINFLIVGPGAGFHNYEIENKRDLPDEFYEDLNNALDQYSLFDFIDADFKFSEVKGKTTFTAPAFRYGITLGYSF